MFLKYDRKDNIIKNFVSFVEILVSFVVIFFTTKDNVLSILNKVGTGLNTIVIYFTETYQNLVELYEATNRPVEALKYQKMLQESEARHYNSEKINAINDVAAKKVLFSMQMTRIENTDFLVLYLKFKTCFE